MSEIVGVRFKKVGKVYNFDTAGIELAVNDHVVVETAQGLEIGQVAIAPRQVTAGAFEAAPAPEAAQVPETGQVATAPKQVASGVTEVRTPLKPVLRKATSEDIQRCQELEIKEKDALEECGKLIDKLKLPMKLLSAEYSLDGQRLTLNFSSVDRVDFRELVRDLARRLRVRVEMRQTGPRDEARLCGGCGRCGRPLCCATFLTEFAPVAMKMAKEQGLPLNPMKISGVCGRLMCCLGYENENYRAMRSKLPRNGQWVSTAQGTARVVGSNPLKQTVQVELESRATAEFPIGEITIVNRPENKLENKPPDRPRGESQTGGQAPRK
ncbi:MAG: regulatory iron-sulfur-containing complex subunit RicT [Chloroflexota bacterium]